MAVLAGLAGCSALGGSKSQADVFHTSAENVDAEVVVYWFWGDGCPHCADQKPFMKELARRDDVAVVALETYNDEKNRKRQKEFAKAYEIERLGVPMTFVGDEYWVGYAEEVKEEVKAKVDSCLEKDCPAPTAKLEA
jgi:glutaredoxin